MTTIDDKELETHHKCIKFTKRQEDHALESLQKSGHASYSYLLTLIEPFDPMRHADLNEDQRNDLRRYDKLENLNMFITVANRSSGESFGELALINDTSRAATIQCLTNCYFATLDREDYNRILKKIELK